MGAHTSLSWGGGRRVGSCTALSRQSPIPVAIYISSVIPCLLLALSLRKGTEVTVCLFFFSTSCAPFRFCWVYTGGACGSVSSFSPNVTSARAGSPARFGFFFL